MPYRSTNIDQLVRTLDHPLREIIAKLRDAILDFDYGNVMTPTLEYRKSSFMRKLATPLVTPQFWTRPRCWPSRMISAIIYSCYARGCSSRQG